MAEQVGYSVHRTRWVVQRGHEQTGADAHPQQLECDDGVQTDDLIVDCTYSSTPPPRLPVLSRLNTVYPSMLMALSLCCCLKCVSVITATDAPTDFRSVDRWTRAWGFDSAAAFRTYSVGVAASAARCSTAAGFDSAEALRTYGVRDERETLTPDSTSDVVPRQLDGQRATM